MGPSLRNMHQLQVREGGRAASGGRESGNHWFSPASPRMLLPAFGEEYGDFTHGLAPAWCLYCDSQLTCMILISHPFKCASMRARYERGLIFIAWPKVVIYTLPPYLTWLSRNCFPFLCDWAKMSAINDFPTTTFHLESAWNCWNCRIKQHRFYLHSTPAITTTI